MSILATVSGVIALIGLIAFYATLYSQVQPAAKPQFESIIGTILVGSIILTVLSYLALIQQTDGFRMGVTMFLAAVSIVMASVSIAVSS